MLKPDDPVFDELMKDLKKVVNGRYLEDAEAPFSGMYKEAGGGERGEEFGELRWLAREDVICAFVPWGDYREQGITDAQVSTIIANVLDKKPQDKWLEGAFDESVLEHHSIAGFKAMVEDRKNSPDNHVFEEMDGDHRPWAELSAAAKLRYITRDAAICDVPFEPFAEAVKKMIGDVDVAALRVVLDGQKELHAIARLFADDGRTEPTPLIERVREVLDYVLALETQEQERLQDREKLPEGMGGAKASDDILREERETPEEGKSQERGGLIRAEIAHVDEIRSLLALEEEERSLRDLHGHDTLSGLFQEIRADEAAAKREDAHGYGYGKAIVAQQGVTLSGRREDGLRDALAMAEADMSPAKAEEGKLSLQDLRNVSQEQERQEGGERGKPREKER